MINRARLTRNQDAIGDMLFKLVLFDDSIPDRYPVFVCIEKSEMENMRSVEALTGALIARLQHKAQEVPGDQAAIRDMIEKVVRDQ